MVSTRETLLEAMGLSADSETARWMQERGVALADEETMSQAIHDVYCGASADHDHPNQKDHEQALVIIAALQKAAAGGAPS
jgi:hypothetical protein